MATIANLLVKISGNNRGLTSSLNRSSQAVSRFQNRTQKSMGTIGSSVNSLKSMFISLGGVIGGIGLSQAFGNIVKTGTAFSDAVADLSAITGATGKDLEFLSNAAKEFGASTTVGASQAATAFKLMASAKPDLLTNNKLLKETTRSAIKLAEASGMELPEATQVLGLALNQFGADAKQADKFVNVLAAGAKFGASEIVDTAEALRDSGVIAASMGVSFEELNGAIQVLAASGIKGSRAGTMLRNVLLQLETSAERRLKPSANGLTAALQALGSANLDASQLAEKFGRESLTAASILAKGAQATSKMTQAVTGTNTAQEQAEIRSSSFGARLKKLKNSLENVGIAIFEKMEPALTKGAEMLTNFLNKASQGKGIFDTFREAIKKNEDLNTIWEGLKIGFTGFIDLLKLSLNGLKDLAPFVGAALTKSFEGLKMLVELLTEKILTLKTELEKLANMAGNNVGNAAFAPVTAVQKGQQAFNVGSNLIGGGKQVLSDVMSGKTNVRDLFNPSLSKIDPTAQRIDVSKSRPQQVNVKIEADKNNLVKATVSNPQFNNAVADKVNSVMKQAARATRS